MTRSAVRGGAIDTRAIKARARAFWNRTPCGTGGNPHPPDSALYYKWIERERAAREPFIAQSARWETWRGRRVLEIGVGAGTDFLQFARAGAHVFGLDLSDRSVSLVRRRVRLESLGAALLVADSEILPFRDEAFDFVYSWGVLHHTPHTETAVREALRVVRPGGRFCVMLYHRTSFYVLQAYIVYGLLRGRPLASVDQIARDHLESYGTRLFSRSQARRLFEGQSVAITHVLTPYDLRYGRRRPMPRALLSIVPAYFGYFMVIEGTKA